MVAFAGSGFVGSSGSRLVVNDQVEDRTSSVVSFAVAYQLYDSPYVNPIHCMLVVPLLTKLFQPIKLSSEAS